MNALVAIFSVTFLLGFIVAAVAGVVAMVQRGGQTPDRVGVVDDGGLSSEAHGPGPFSSLTAAVFLTSFGAGGLIAQSSLRLGPAMCMLFAAGAGVAFSGIASFLAYRMGAVSG